MGLLEKFDQIKASKKAVATVKPSKPTEPVLKVLSVEPGAHFQKNELLAASNTTTDEIDFSVIELFYPDQPDLDSCPMILDEVRQLSVAKQTNWWLALSVWLNTGTGDLDWRCATFDQLSACWQQQPRQDFELARKIFAGPGSQVITEAKNSFNDNKMVTMP